MSLQNTDLVSFRAMELRPGTRLWPRGVALYGLGRYADAACFLELCALSFAHKFEYRPTTELLWAAAARAKLGEPCFYGTRQRQQPSDNDENDNNNNDEIALGKVNAVFAAALEAARAALGVGVPDDNAAAVSEAAVVDLDALEVAAQAAFGAAFAARERWADANASKAAAAAVEDYARAAVLKADAEALAADADAADARAAAASAAVAAATAAAGAAAAGTGTVAARLAAMLAKYPREPNPVLAAAWALFTGAGDLEALGAVVLRAQAAARAAPGGRRAGAARGDADPLGRVFLGHLYAGLWLDATAAASAPPVASVAGSSRRADAAEPKESAKAAAAREAAAAAAATHFAAAVRAARVGGAFGAGYDAGFLVGLARAAAEWSTAAAGDVPVEEPTWTC
jgi:hypothetical protein